MLVIKKIKYYDKHVESWICDKGMFDSVKYIEFTILDTESNSKKCLSLSDTLQLIKYNYKNLFGVVETDNSCIFFEVSDSLWKYLDFTDGVRRYYNISTPQVSSSQIIQYHYSAGTEFHIGLQRFAPLDKNYLFWIIYGNGYTTLLDLYRIASEFVELKDYTDVVIHVNHTAYSLELNNDIMFLLTKYITLSSKDSIYNKVIRYFI